MPSQTNRTALRQLEKTDFLVVSAKTQKPTVNDRLQQMGVEIFGEGSGEAPAAPDWNQLQEWSIAALETSAAEVRRTDREHRKSRVRLGKVREDRDQLVTQLASGHRSLRHSFTGTYGTRSLPLVGLDAVPARALKAVQEQMRDVVGRMRDPALTAALPEPLAGQPAIELDELADAREAEVVDLEAKTAETDQLRKQMDESMVVRDQALARNRRVYTNVGRLLEGVYRLVGLDELADRIRATERSPRRRPEGATGDESPSPEPASEPSAPEPGAPEPAQEGGEAA